MVTRRLPSTVLALALVGAPGLLRAESLAELYQQALANNPVFLARELGVDAARAQRTQARSSLLPQLSASGSYSENEYEDDLSGERDYGGERGVLQARQALFDLTSWFRLEGARATILQREEEREAARMELAGELVDRYLEVLQTEDELAYLQAEKDATLRQQEQLRFMHQRQLAKVTDLYEVEAYHQGLLTREIEARNAKDVALETLRETTGVPVSAVTPLRPGELPPVPGEEQQWLSAAAANNRTLVALQHAIEAARQLVSSERARHLPQLALTATYTDSDQGYDNRELPPYAVSSVGVQLTIPLYEGGRVSGSVSEARARHGIALQEYEQALRETQRETRTAYLGARASRARIASTANEVAALEKVLDAQQKSYQLGVSTIVDVLLAQRRLFRSRSDHAKARYDYLRDLTGLKIRAGSLALADVEEIDRLMLRPVPAPN
jgi:outer membrane protein